MVHSPTPELAFDGHPPNEKEVLTFERPLPLSIRASALVFDDPSSRELLHQIRLIAPSDASVLITGETGTGKELVARHIHSLSARRQANFEALNCAALSETLIESELFGHDKGAFTGAMTARAGWFETANHGTLFLDEIGDMPLALQAKLLRVLQEREVTRVGSRKATQIDVRVVVATNVNLEEAVNAGHFRADLYYRLNVVHLRLKPLRERPGDILPLVHHFIESYGSRLGYSKPTLSPSAVDCLINYPWPGNIRELENAVHRAILVCPGPHLRAEDFKLNSGQIGFSRRDQGSIESLDAAIRNLFERNVSDLYEKIDEAVIRAAYDYCNENQLQTAKLLGISRNVVRHRLARHSMLPLAGPDIG